MPDQGAPRRDRPLLRSFALGLCGPGLLVSGPVRPLRALCRGETTVRAWASVGRHLLRATAAAVTPHQKSEGAN